MGLKRRKLNDSKRRASKARSAELERARKRQANGRKHTAAERKAAAESSARHRAAVAEATAELAAEGPQLMVPGVLPRPMAHGNPELLKKTVATLSLTRAEMQRHRVALAASGYTSWQHWTLELLNREAERVIGGGRK